MFEPKVPVIGAITGFVLSFLVGLLSGVAFPVVLLRAALMALVFAGLAFGGKFLIQQFVPELVAPSSVDASVPAGGSMVDITVGETEREENPFNISPETNMGDIPDFARDRAAADTGSVPPSQETASVAAGEFRPDPLLSAAPARADKPSGDFTGESAGGLDILPDLADFVPQTVKKDDSAESPADTAAGRRDSLFDTSELKGSSSPAETETMAKAIRTVLTRDT